MRILATIPELQASVCRATAAPEPRAADPGPGRRMRREAKPRFPLGSIAALVALAAVAWTLAGWNDARRTGRQQAELRQAGERIAEQPARAEEPMIR